MARLPFLDADRLTPAQKEVYDHIAAGSRGRVGFMYRTLLHSPGLAKRLEGVGEYLRYQTALSARLKELAIVTVAAYWQADVEWASHAPLARNAGISDDVLASLAARREPVFAETTDRLVYDYVSDVLRGAGASERTYDAALAAFGTETLLDLTGIAGYYTMLAMVLNAFDVRPPDADIPWRRQS
jgi:4-carboxymuconolactone decarboxylase